MSSIEDAYETTMSDLISSTSFDNNDIELELFKMIHDRESIYNNTHIANSIYKNKHIISQGDIDAVLNTTNMDSYIRECKIFKDILARFVSDISNTVVERELSKNKVDRLTDVLNIFKTDFPQHASLIEASENLLNVELKDFSTYEDKLVQLNKKLYILHKFSPHYVQNDPRNLCSICVVREVDTCISPCGHTLCSQCSNKMLSKNCFVCRTEIDKNIKMFFS